MIRYFSKRFQSKFMSRVSTRALFGMALLALWLQGCTARAWRVRRLARQMLDPTTSPRESLSRRQRLMELAPESGPFLSQAFFPIGLYDVPESALQEIAAAGFNLVVNGGKDARYLARAEAAGVKVIPYINHAKMREEVERVHGRRAILAWYLMDEPDLNEVAPEEYSRLARRLRKLDRARPIYLTAWSPLRYGDYVNECDILAPNPYPILHEEPELNNLRLVGIILDAARESASGRPVWAILQAFYAEPMWPRNPTPRELRAMVFLALNHGADGIIYFSYKSGGRPITEHRELFAEISRINGHVRALRGALLARPIRPVRQVEVKQDERPATLQMPADARASAPLDCSIRNFGGAQLLIAVNPDPWPKTMDIHLPGGDTPRKATALFADEGPAPIDIQAGAPITAQFAPFQVRLYWIE